MIDMTDTNRQAYEFTLTSSDKGKIRVKVFDRINVDDVFTHLVNRQLYRIITSQDPGDTIAEDVKKFLIEEEFLVGQF